MFVRAASSWFACFALVAGCSGSVAEGASPPRVERGVSPAAGVAVVRVAQVEEECTGLGGVHAILTVESFALGGGVTRAHFGGHGVRGLTSGDVGRIFVAEVIPRPQGFALGKGVCVELMTFDGLAGALRPAGSREQALALAEARVRELRAGGWAGGEVPPACAAVQDEAERRRCVTRWHAPFGPGSAGVSAEATR